MAGIFISYRRSDSAGSTGRLMDDLKAQFPDCPVFRDIEAIEAGADFVEAIDAAVKSCSVLLAVIGPRWLSATNKDGKRRIDDPNDFVRLEISAALRRDVRVIPVLVEDATMPSAEELPEDIKAFARRQAHELSDRRWDYDATQLFGALEKVHGIRRKPPRPVPPPAPRKKSALGPILAVTTVGIFVLLGVIVQQVMQDSSELTFDPTSVSTPTPQPQPQQPQETPEETPRQQPQQTRPRKQPPQRPQQTPQPQPDEDIVNQGCGQSAMVAGTWLLGAAGAEPGLWVMTQDGNTLTAAEFNVLGQQLSTGTGKVCGQTIQITATNVLLGEFSMTANVSGGVMTGTVGYQGMQFPFQAFRQ
jgi:hypothetical protein